MYIHFFIFLLPCCRAGRTVWVYFLFYFCLLKCMAIGEDNKYVNTHIHMFWIQNGNRCEMLPFEKDECIMLAFFLYTWSLFVLFSSICSFTSFFFFWLLLCSLSLFHDLFFCACEYMSVVLLSVRIKFTYADSGSIS